MFKKIKDYVVKFVKSHPKKVMVVAGTVIVVAIFGIKVGLVLGVLGAGAFFVFDKFLSH